MSFRLIASFLLLWPFAARADMPPDGLAAAKSAVEQFDALAAARRPGDMPRLSDAEARPVLERVWNTKSILGRQPHPGSELGTLANVMETENSVLKAYVGFGLGDAMTETEAGRNTFRFQDEVARASAFISGTQAALLQSAEDLVAHLAPGALAGPRLAGLRQMQSGSAEVVQANLTMISEPALRDENRLVIASALAGNIDVIAREMPLPKRAELLTAARRALPRAGGAAEPLSHVVEALSDTKCEGLCRVGAAK